MDFYLLFWCGEIHFYNSTYTKQNPRKTRMYVINETACTLSDSTLVLLELLVCHVC